MRIKKIFLIIIVLILASFACSVNINLPQTNIKTGPTLTDSISVPFVDGEANLKLSLGGGKLILTAGDNDELVFGTAVYNVEDFKPEVEINDTNINIEQGSLNVEGFPQFDRVENTWDLSLGDAPIALTVNAGAYQGRYDLGGLRLTNLTIEDGAADVELDFSSPNLTEMGIFDYQTGASSVTLSNLANANFTTMFFRSGLGNYTLDFSGRLQQDGTVKIETGLSNVKVIIPEGVSARVTIEGGLSNISTSGSWEISGDTYTQAGSGPTLDVTIEMGAGNLDLVNSP